jgi:hypothetical protein
MWFIKILKFPLWLLRIFVKKPKKRINKRKQKQLKHVRHFDPTRLKNRTWQKSFNKNKQKKKRKNKENSIKKVKIITKK